MKIYYFLCIAFIQAIATVQAQDIYYDHCTDCGVTLVGAAQVKFHAIRWQGSAIASGRTFELPWTAKWYGYMGASNAQKQLDPSKITYREPATVNQWVYGGHSQVYLSSVTPSEAPFMGFYFSPTNPGDFSITYDYALIGTPTKVTIPLKGKGIIDNEQSPALTIDIDGITDGTVSELSVENEKNFVITAKLSPENLPTEVNSSSIKYAMVEVVAQEKYEDGKDSKECSISSSQFTDVIQIQSAQQTENSFYQSITGDKGQAYCQRFYYFLVSINNPFNFKVKKQNSSSKVYTEYSFFIRGHYDFQPNSTRYPGSHHTFRLRTSNVTPTTNKLTVNVNGNGNISSSSAGINCPASSCSANYTTGTSVSLTATPNTNAKFSGWSGDCSGTSTPTDIILNTDKSCVATFSDTTSTPDTFNLQAIVNNTAGGKIKVNGIVCTQSCIQKFSKDASVTLVAEAETGYTFDGWTGTTNQCEGKKTASLNVIMNSEQACTAIFVKETVVAVEKACFNIDYVNDPDTKIINRVKLDAACSGVASSYNWLIYPLNGGNPVTNSGASFTTNKLADGSYTVTLIVGEDEAQNQISQNFTIPPLLARFEIKSDAGKLTLDASTTSRAIDSGEVTYRWWSSLGQTIKNGITAVVDYTTGILDVIGKYETITLTVTDEKGRISSTSQKAKVNTAMPVEITSFDYSHLKTRTEKDMTIVTLRAQAQDPDGGEISHSFRDSYGNTVQGEEIEEDGEQWLEVSFVYPTTLGGIAETYYLNVTDNEGTTAEATLHIPMPALNANAIDSKGNNSSTTSLFYGGISNENGINYKKELSINSTDMMAIRGYFKTDISDVGKMADTLLVLGYGTLPNTIFYSFSNVSGLTPLKLDGTDPDWIVNLSALENVTLDEEMPVTIPFTGIPQQFFPNFKGTIYFYLGYRLEDGKIVYSFPISLTIQ